MKKIIFSLFIMSVFLSSVCGLAQEEKKERLRVSGMVLSYNRNVLRIQERMDVGIIRLYSFKITSETKIIGELRENGWVSVVYTIVKIKQRWIRTAVEILSLGR